MKRSEAVKKIVEIVNYHDGGSIEPYVADRLLEVLVDGFGMLPPKIENVECISSSGYLSLDAALTRGLHEWEPEND